MRSTKTLLKLATGLLPFSLVMSSAHAGCFEEAAHYQHVNPLILRAIAWQESHDHPEAVHLNENGSIDYGLMQINTIHLPTLARYGIDKGALMSPCKAVYIAAWHLRAQLNRYGNTWAAIGAYHSATPIFRDDYAVRIATIVRCMEQQVASIGAAAGNVMPVATGGSRGSRQTTKRPARACPTQ
jgi:hypothetical protein